MYKELLANGTLSENQPQANVISELQSLYDKVHKYTPSSSSGWFSSGPKPGPKGIYIHGSVGGGKTTLMDLFFDCCTVRVIIDALLLARDI